MFLLLFSQFCQYFLLINSHTIDPKNAIISSMLRSLIIFLLGIAGGYLIAVYNSPCQSNLSPDNASKVKKLMR